MIGIHGCHLYCLQTACKTSVDSWFMIIISSENLICIIINFNKTGRCARTKFSVVKLSFQLLVLSEHKLVNLIIVTRDWLSVFLIDTVALTLLQGPGLARMTGLVAKGSKVDIITVTLSSNPLCNISCTCTSYHWPERMQFGWNHRRVAVWLLLLSQLFHFYCDLKEVSIAQTTIVVCLAAEAWQKSCLGFAWWWHTDGLGCVAAAVTQSLFQSCCSHEMFNKALLW